MAPYSQARQGQLFGGDTGLGGGAGDTLPLLKHQLLEWQQRLASHQSPLFAAAAKGLTSATAQGSLFESPRPTSLALSLNPLALAAQHLQFWRWPQPQHQGAAVYFVLDQPPHRPEPLLLYVGETCRADQRWKGEHDCKSYLAAYGEALQQVGLDSQLNIRFWSDAPAQVKPRRALEQELIRHWLPPFNKETRARWATPFTTDLD
jgi:hypothetical protein